MIKIENKADCCGCESCVQACPKQCISMESDLEGFYYPKALPEICINCGMCEKVCPILNVNNPNKPINVLAAINPNEEIREESSSGGIFTMLAEEIIHAGGVVFGVRFTEDWQAEFSYTETVSGLNAFRGSKYVQAHVGRVYTEVRDFLNQGRKVLFSGTPCQIAGLRNFLRKDNSNLLTIDFACHGVPSPKVWSQYLNEVTRNAKRAIRDVQFRNKKQGWKRFNFNMSYSEDEKEITLSSWHQKNHYMQAFLNDIILRPSCYSCRAKGGRSGSDITIADFWGIGRLNPKMDDDRGTSLVLINSLKGKRLYDDCTIPLQWMANYDDILKLNPAIDCSAKLPPTRKKFFERLDSDESLVNIIEDILKQPFIVRMLVKTKHFIHQLFFVNGGGKNSAPIPTSADKKVKWDCDLVRKKQPVKFVSFRSKGHSWINYRVVIMITTNVR